ncbi:hypothetical protein ACFQRK_23630 [Parapedobacter sp. GCM10030251]|uniref:hypothetical protein n=1 Tax=Parapedobacter sp. GCM10030251 TaxID=3273419 RepID=UPI0036203C06
MKIIPAIIVLLSSCISTSCTSDKRDNPSHVEAEQYLPKETYPASDFDYDDFNKEEYEYEDGVYCATVDYYNPNTGNSNSYVLNVEIESDELITIYWPNGGWLDESHFSSENISIGSCTFTSDKGYEYTVTIIGEQCQYTDTNILPESEEDESHLLDDLENFESDEYDEYVDEF